MEKNSFSENEKKTRRKGGPEGVDQAAGHLTKTKREGVSLGEGIEAYVRKQPLAAVGIALGTGFVLGGIFGSRLGRIALAATIGYAAEKLTEAALGEGVCGSSSWMRYRDWRRATRRIRGLERPPELQSPGDSKSRRATSVANSLCHGLEPSAWERDGARSRGLRPAERATVGLLSSERAERARPAGGDLVDGLAPIRAALAADVGEATVDLGRKGSIRTRAHSQITRCFAAKLTHATEIV
jgi:hypothetical protein